MFDIKKLKENCIIITPSSLKKDILLETNKLDFDIKFMDKRELEENTFFSYGDDAVAFVMDKGYSYANAKEILANLYYLKEGTGSSKIDELIAIKKELDDAKLLKYNPVFKYLFVNKKVYVYHYSTKDRELKCLLEQNNINYEFLDDVSLNNQLEIYKFKTIEEEVFSVFNMICQRYHEDHIPLNKIKLVNYSSDYDLLVKKYASFYNLPLNFKGDMYLYDSPYFKEFLNMLEEEISKEKSGVLSEEEHSNFYNRVYEKAVDYVTDKKVDNYKVIDAIKGILVKANRLFEGDREKQKEYIITLSKNKKLSLNSYENGIDIIDIDYVKDDYIFVLGFNLLSYPLINRDIDYISDEYKEKLGINTSSVLNEIELEKVRNFLNAHNHLNLSYKEKIGKTVFYPSLLVDSYKMKINNKYQPKTVYSFKALKNKVVKSNDLLEDYRIKDGYQNTIDINSKDMDFRIYKNDFETFDALKNQPDVDFSYTSIDTYYSCPFYYYLKYILNLEDYEERFNTELGKKLHTALEKHVNEGANILDFEDEIVASFETGEEKFFASKLLKQIDIVSEFNDSMFIGNPNLKAEGEVECCTCPFAGDTNYPKSYEKIKLKGSIDRIVSSEEDKVLYIVDYKSYSVAFKAKKVEYGIGMQLPIYLYFGKMDQNKYKGYEISGAYIQKITANPKDESNFRNTGITVNNRALLNVFEPIIPDRGYSKYFSSVHYLSKGNIQTSRLPSIIEKEDLDNIVDLAIEKVKEAIDSIKKGEFPINPYRINESDNETGCFYCKNRSICFKKDKDYREIDLKSEGDE